MPKILLKMLLTMWAHLPASSKDAVPVITLLLRPLYPVFSLSHLVTYSFHYTWWAVTERWQRLAGHFLHTQINHHPHRPGSRARPFRVQGGRRHGKGKRKNYTYYVKNQNYKDLIPFKNFNNSQNTPKYLYCLLNIPCNSTFSHLGSHSLICLQLLSFPIPLSLKLILLVPASLEVVSLSARTTPDLSRDHRACPMREFPLTLYTVPSSAL